MFNSSLTNLEVPVLIPKRGKGYFETNVSLDVQTQTFVDPIQFVDSLYKIQSQTMTLESLSDAALELSHKLNLQHLTVTSSFNYFIDRISPAYNSTFFSLPVQYSVRILPRQEPKPSMSITVPVVVSEISATMGSLNFFVEFPAPRVHIEDLLDYTQKNGNAWINPPTCLEEKESLRVKMNNKKGKTPYEYLSLMEDSAVKQKIGRSGRISISCMDVYRMYKSVYTNTWAT